MNHECEVQFRIQNVLQNPQMTPFESNWWIYQILTFHVASFDASQKRYVVKVDDRSGDGQGCDEILNSLGLILPAIMFKRNKSMAKRHTSPQNSMIFKGIILSRT